MLISRTPFRISFVGGGSDLPVYCDRKRGAVLSVTIDKSMYVALHPYFDDRKTLLRYSRTELVDDLDGIQHPIFREALRLFGIRGGIEISSSADIPSGTGLGSSSSFTVGLLHVLAAFECRYPSQEYLASMASKLEIEILKEPIGRQDQYAAAYGGLNVIEFGVNGQVRVEPICIGLETVETLEKRILMFYIGGQRATRTILADQRDGLASDQEKFKATEEMVSLVYEMRDSLYRCDMAMFGELLHRNWELKRKLSKHISNAQIDEAYDRARNSGALGGKLLGAGGSGFLLVFAEPRHHAEIRKSLSDFDELPLRFGRSGSQIIYSDGVTRSTGSGFIGVGRRAPGLVR